MKKRLLSIAVIFCMCVVIFSAVGEEADAAVRGSTQYLINQAKSSYYVNKTLRGVKDGIRKQGYNGWKMNYNRDWCAWYLSNCANCAYLGNYPGGKVISKSVTVDTLANNFAKYNGTTKKYNNYTPKAGDIVVEGRNRHIGIMISSTKAAYGNDGSVSNDKTKVVIRKPSNVYYYVPRANWYEIYYSDGLKSTSNSEDMKINPPKKATFGVYTATSTKKYSRKGYTYSYLYIYRQDYNKSTNTFTNYYFSVNDSTGKTAWVKSGTSGYTKYKIKVGANIKYYYTSTFAGSYIVLTPVWVKK